MFVLAIPGGEFPRAIVERAFAPYVDDVKDDWIPRLPTGEAASAWMSLKPGEMIDGFSINRPPGFEGFPGFWDAVFEVMRQTPTWCFIPGGGWEENCCVAQADIISEELIEFAGGRERVRVALSGAELATAAWA